MFSYVHQGCIYFTKKLYYSFSRFLKHISWNYASFLRTSKHESITSNSIPQTSYIQVKMKLSTQNNSILLKKQTLLSDMTHKQSKHTHYNTVSHTDEINSKQYYKNGNKCGTPQMFYSSI